MHPKFVHGLDPVTLRVPRRIIAVGYGTFFARMAIVPEAYTSRTFDNAFDIAGARVWGIALSLLFLVVFFIRSRVVNITLSAVLMAWSVGLLLADLAGTTQAPLAWTSPMAIALLFVWGIGKRQNP